MRTTSSHSQLDIAYLRVTNKPKKKKKKDQFAIKTDRRQTEKNEEIHAQINRTNLFFAGRAVSLPTHEQKLVSLALN